MGGGRGRGMPCQGCWVLHAVCGLSQYVTPRTPLPLESSVLADGLNESFVWTLNHNKGEPRVRGSTDLFSQNLQGQRAVTSQSSASTASTARPTSPLPTAQPRSPGAQAASTGPAGGAPLPPPAPCSLRQASDRQRAFQTNSGQKARPGAHGSLRSVATGPQILRL